jgi:hypothetical protein
MMLSQSRKSDLVGQREKEQAENKVVSSEELLEENGNRCLSKII